MDGTVVPSPCSTAFPDPAMAAECANPPSHGSELTFHIQLKQQSNLMQGLAKICSSLADGGLLDGRAQQASWMA
eukprot:scaffold169803_cov19-Tisochrysis_lutea.AAC.1